MSDEQPAGAAEGKTTAKTTVVKKRPQQHGGALNQGGTHGNRGGSGRPPSRLRAVCRRMASTRLQVLGSISSKKSNSKDSDKIKAIDVLLKYGMDRSVSIADLRNALHEMSELAYEMFPKDQADAFLAACGPIFKRL